jgi:hypothetical protein
LHKVPIVVVMLTWEQLFVALAAAAGLACGLSAVAFYLRRSRASLTTPALPTSGGARTIIVVGAIVGIFLAPTLGRGVAGRGFVVALHFYVAAAIITASTGALLALLAGGTLSRNACLLFGMAAGYLLPEAIDAVLLKTLDWRAYGWGAMGMIESARPVSPFFGLFLGLIARRFTYAFSDRSRRAALATAAIVCPLTLFLVMAWWGDLGRLRLDKDPTQTFKTGLFLLSLALISTCTAAVVAGERSGRRGFEVREA